MAIDRTLTAPIGPNQEQFDQYGDRLFVTTERRLSSSQHSVWVINTLDGSLDWSVSAGQIRSDPVVRGDRVYIASISGNLTALDKSDGSVLWTLAHYIPFLSNFSVSQAAPYENLIALTDYFGDVVLARDNGNSAEWLWTTDLDTGAGEMAINQPVIDDLNGYIYVGANNGRIYQLDIETGITGPSRTVSAVGDDVVELLRQPLNQSSPRPYTHKLLAATDHAKLARFCTPFMYPPGTLVADGDINTDGFVNALDVLLGTQAIFGIRLLDPVEFGHGDVAPVISSVPNPNGTFDLGDLLMITRKALFGSF